MDITKNDLKELKTDLLEAVRSTVKEEVKTTVKEEMAVVKADLLEAVETSVKSVKAELLVAVETMVTDEGRSTRDFVVQEIRASETRMTSKMEAMRVEIISDLVDVIDNGIHPQLDDHETRLKKLETAAV